MLIVKLKQYWNDMNENSKKNVWKYLKVLLLLNEKMK